MKEQIILKQVDKDPAQNQGPATIKARINWDQNIRLPRSLVSSVMRTHNPDGFLQRGPNSKQILRFPKTPAGINERWSGDGHDKLKKIGFPVWAVVDDATGKWLGAWVIPCNRLSDIVGYLFLDLVETVGGVWFFNFDSSSPFCYSSYWQGCQLSSQLIVVPRLFKSMVLQMPYGRDQLKFDLHCIWHYLQWGHVRFAKRHFTGTPLCS